MEEQARGPYLVIKKGVANINSNDSLEIPSKKNMSTGARVSNARPGGGYQTPVMPTTNRFGRDVIKAETWDEVLHHLQTVIEENAALNETLQQNNSKVQEVLNKKNREIEAAQKLYWDVRISVLGFKAQIMKLTGEIEQLRDENAGKSSENVNNSEALAELERKKQELERLKSTAEVNASVLNEELKSVRSQLSNMEVLYQGLLSDNSKTEEIKRHLETRVKSLEIELQKRSTMPQPKPRANVITKQDGKISQLERERDEARFLMDKLRQDADLEKNSREQAEQKWLTARAELERVKQLGQVEMEERERQLDEIRRKLSETKRQNESLAHQHQMEQQSAQNRISQLQREVSELRTNASPGGGGASIAAGGGGGGGMLRLRRMLDAEISEKERYLHENNAMKESLSVKEQEVASYERMLEDVQVENSRLREQCRGNEQELKELREKQGDKEYELDQKVTGLTEEKHRLQEQLQNSEERYHSLYVQHTKAMSDLNSHKHENQEWEQGLSEMEKAVDELMTKVETKESTIQKLQDRILRISSEKDSIEKDKERLLKKLQDKQADCDSYLEKSEVWRAQYELAQSDFAQERQVREKEAFAVKTLRENRDALQKEISDLRKRVTDQQMVIAQLQSSSSVIPETYTQIMNVPGDASPNMRRNNPPYYGEGRSDYTDDSSTAGLGGFTSERPLDYGGGGGVQQRFGGEPRPTTTRDYDGGGFRRQQLFDHQPLDTSYDVPNPRLGEVPNQLDNPPSPPQPAGRTDRTSSHQLANPFPQFPPTGKREPPSYPPEAAATHGLIDLPGEVTKMEAPQSSCPICGRTDFKTQTDLEVHCAKCIG